MTSEGRKLKTESRNHKSEARRLKAGGGERTRTNGPRLNPKNWGQRPALAGLVCLTALSFAQNGNARKPEPNLTFTVGVYNYAHASPSTLAGAEHEAARILGLAGVRVLWLDCRTSESATESHSPCQKSVGPAYIEMRILAQPLKNIFRDDPMGFAVPPAMANVYYQRAMLFVRGDASAFASQTILGCVMAHEIGHLLLGPNCHSDLGIMRATWEREDMQPRMVGGRLFTPAQAKLIRAEVKRREGSQTATPKSTQMGTSSPSLTPPDARSSAHSEPIMDR